VEVTEAPTVKVTEAATEAPTVEVTEAPTEEVTEAAAEAPVEEVVEEKVPEVVATVAPIKMAGSAQFSFSTLSSAADFTADYQAAFIASIAKTLGVGEGDVVINMDALTIADRQGKNLRRLGTLDIPFEVVYAQESARDAGVKSWNDVDAEGFESTYNHNLVLINSHNALAKIALSTASAVVPDGVAPSADAPVVVEDTAAPTAEPTLEPTAPNTCSAVDLAAAETIREAEESAESTGGAPFARWTSGEADTKWSYWKVELGGELKGFKVEITPEVAIAGDTSLLQVVLCPKCPLDGKCMDMHFYDGHSAYANGDDSATRSISGTADGQKLMWYVDGAKLDKYEVGVNDEDLVSLSDTWYVGVKLAPPAHSIVSPVKIFLRTRFGMNACYTYRAPSANKKTADTGEEADARRRRLSFLQAMPQSVYTALAVHVSRGLTADAKKTAHPTPAPVTPHTPNTGTLTNEIIEQCQEYVAASEGVNGFDYPTLAVNLHRKPSMPSGLNSIAKTCNPVQKVWCYQTHYMCDASRNGLALKPAPSVCMDLEGSWEEDKRDSEIYAQSRVDEGCGALVQSQAKKMHHFVCNLAPDGIPAKSNFGNMPNTFPKAPVPIVPCEPVHFACETPECYLTRRPLGCICRTGRQPECQLEW
jgi:hypothetical protein